MEDRFAQQLKKGLLELLVLNLICQSPTYGYELLSRLKAESDGRFALKEGTLYPILYRLEDDGLISAQWSQGQGRTAPKKIYTATERGREVYSYRQQVWQDYQQTVNHILSGGKDNDRERKANEEIFECNREKAESSLCSKGESYE